ncbi:hypothetical protein BACI71_90316 [Bacillus mycoides]|uniref:Uncharacterized protein n=1 Tax=Bacillus mycoides TaxID=1405 RepID=A0A654CC82_BACMY|nr:hypothetical protein BACI71_90316 [Bacillus mycoides]
MLTSFSLMGYVDNISLESGAFRTHNRYPKKWTLFYLYLIFTLSLNFSIKLSI